MTGRGELTIAHVSPERAREGDIITVIVAAANVGQRDQFWIRAWRPDVREHIVQWVGWLDRHRWHRATGSFTMPDRDVIIKFRVSRRVGDRWVLDDEETRTVTHMTGRGELTIAHVSPERAREGDIITVIVAAANVGQRDQFWIRAWRPDVREHIVQWVGWLDRHRWHRATGSFTMPDRDVIIKFRVSRRVGDRWVLDDEETRTVTHIPLLQGFADVISLEAPDSAAPGDIITIRTTVKNTGEVKDLFRISIVGETVPGHRTILASVDVEIDVGKSHTLTTTAIMPDIDFKIEGVGQTWVG